MDPWKDPITFLKNILNNLLKIYEYLGPYEVLEILGKGNLKISVKNKP